MTPFRPFGKVLCGATASILLLSGRFPAAHAQFSNPTVTYSPVNPVSTEPLSITLAAPLPDGATYTLAINYGLPPHGQAASCQAVQKSGSATCLLGRLAPGFYIVTSLTGGAASFQPFNFNVSAPGPNTVSTLQDQYAFLVTDRSSTRSTPTGAAAAGSFTADGKGNITAGVIDVNQATGTFQDLSVTGSYTLNAAGQGTITLNTSQGTVSFAVVVPTAQTLSNVRNGDLVALPGSLVTGGGTLVNQSGLLQSKGPVNPGFGATLTGGYVGTFAGEIGTPASPLGGALQLTFAPAGSVTSAGQLSINGGSVNFAGLSGTYTPVDGTTGRTTFTVAAPGQAGFSFAAYETSQQSFYYLSLASHATNPIFSGAASQ